MYSKENPMVSHGIMAKSKSGREPNFTVQMPAHNPDMAVEFMIRPSGPVSGVLSDPMPVPSDHAVAHSTWKHPR